ncbi:MAG: hypothetical protein ACFYI8_00425 [Candidatus Karelsulcia muelleri]
MKKLKKRKLILIFIIGLLTIYKKSYIHEYEIIQLIDGLSLKLKKNIIYFMNKLIISFIYIYVINFFIKRICEKEKDFKKKRKYSVLFGIFFSLIFPLIGWNWIMFFHLDWISTIFNWYLIGTYLVLGISLISLISIYRIYQIIYFLLVFYGVIFYLHNFC